ncbi:serpentine type 7TM GPCR chemoreceptor srh domain-containing protein [Ditylenchus destructor]|nr:serpentine type 7TM GPCR chemoreceptor srh domain-containing protein [Ditylenchus destructor]
MLCWVCLKKSPRSMNDYKWYILINATNGVIFETLLTLAHPELFLPYPLLVIGGAARNLTALHPAFKYIFGDLFMLSFISIFYFTVELFLFRYSQTVDNWLYRRIFSKSKVGMPLNAFILLIFLCGFIIPQNSGMIARDSAIESMRDVDAVVYERMRNRVVLGSVPSGPNPQQTISTVLIVLFLIIFLAVIAFSIYGCYRSLRRMRPVLSKRTASLYLALINSLVLDMAMAGFLTFVPVIVTIIALQSNSPYTSIIATVGLQFGSLYPLAANIILIAYVTPYRRATINLFWRILGREVSSVDLTTKFTSSAEQNPQLFRSRATSFFTLGTRGRY